MIIGTIGSLCVFIVGYVRIYCNNNRDVYKECGLTYHQTTK